MSADEAKWLKGLFDAHYSGLCAFAVYFITDEAEAENIVQQVFVELWERRASLLSNRSLKSYLFTAVRNRCLNAIRNQRTEELDDQFLTDDDPSSRIEYAELAAHINRLVMELPTRCRYIFLRSRRDGFSHREIAEELGLSVKTVENQMAKALKYVRSRINNTDNE